MPVVRRRAVPTVLEERQGVPQKVVDGRTDRPLRRAQHPKLSEGHHGHLRIRENHRRRPNHYPDFLVQTKNGKTLLTETKGDDRDNSDSERELKLGNAWAAKAGNRYRYFMVFEKNPIAGAYRMDEVLPVIANL